MISYTLLKLHLICQIFIYTSSLSFAPTRSPILTPNPTSTPRPSPKPTSTSRPTYTTFPTSTPAPTTIAPSAVPSTSYPTVQNKNLETVITTKLRFTLPSAIWVANDNEYYVADNVGLIKHVNSSLGISVIAGGGSIPITTTINSIPALTVNFGIISGITGDNNGNVYFTLSNLQRIYKVDKFGNITHFAGNGQQNSQGDGGKAVSAGVYYPWGITIDPAGKNFYIAEVYGQRIRAVSILIGNISSVAGQHPIAESYNNIYNLSNLALISPYAVICNGDGTILYVGDANRVFMINLKKQFATTLIGNGNIHYLSTVTGLSRDSQGHLYIAEGFSQRIQRYTFPSYNLRNHSLSNLTVISGVYNVAGYQGDGGLAKNALYRNPYSVAIDCDGNLLVTDYSNGRLRSIQYEGSYSTCPNSDTEPLLTTGAIVGICIGGFFFISIVLAMVYVLAVRNEWYGFQGISCLKKYHPNGFREPVEVEDDKDNEKDNSILNEHESFRSSSRTNRGNFPINSQALGSESQETMVPTDYNPVLGSPVAYSRSASLKLKKNNIVSPLFDPPTQRGSRISYKMRRSNNNNQLLTQMNRSESEVGDDYYDPDDMEDKPPPEEQQRFRNMEEDNRLEQQIQYPPPDEFEFSDENYVSRPEVTTPDTNSRLSTPLDMSQFGKFNTSPKPLRHPPKQIQTAMPSPRSTPAINQSTSIMIAHASSPSNSFHFKTAASLPRQVSAEQREFNSQNSALFAATTGNKMNLSINPSSGSLGSYQGSPRLPFKMASRSSIAPEVVLTKEIMEN